MFGHDLRGWMAAHQKALQRLRQGLAKARRYLMFDGLDQRLQLTLPPLRASLFEPSIDPSSVPHDHRCDAISTRKHDAVIIQLSNQRYRRTNSVPQRAGGHYVTTRKR